MEGASPVRSRIRNWTPSWLQLWAADSGVLLFSRLAAILATTALAVLLARNLGPRDWGLFSGFLSLSLALSVFAEFGVSQWLLRELARLWVGSDHKSGSKEAQRTAGRLVAATFAVNTLIGGALVVAASVTTMVLHAGFGPSLALVALVAYSALLASSTGLEAYFRSRRKLSRIVGATLLEKVTLLLFVAVFLVLDLGLVSIAAAYVLAGLLRLAFDSALVFRSNAIVLSAPSLANIRHVVQRSLPFAINRTSLNLIPRLDTFILAAFSPLVAGYFALGDRVLGPILIVPVVMSSALYPFLAGEPRGSRSGWRVVILLALLGIVFTAVAVATAPTLIPLVFGSQYAKAIPVAQLMFLAIPFVYAANPLLAHLYSEDREQRLLSIGLAAVALVGTAAIVAGQLIAGGMGAASGYLLRNFLFVITLVAVGVRPVSPHGASVARAPGLAAAPVAETFSPSQAVSREGMG